MLCYPTCLITFKVSYLAERTVTSRDTATCFVPRTPLKDATASLHIYHCQNFRLQTTYATPISTSAILFYQSTRCHLPTIRHGLALLRPFSTTYPHGGTLPPRDLAFPNTSRLPKALTLFNLASSAPSRF